jgi:hypothetical protein
MKPTNRILGNLWVAFAGTPEMTPIERVGLALFWAGVALSSTLTLR